jgi:hypothetical protein
MVVASTAFTRAARSPASPTQPQDCPDGENDQQLDGDRYVLAARTGLPLLCTRDDFASTDLEVIRPRRQLVDPG